MLWVHRTAGTWQSHIDAYIAPSEFARRMFLGAGLPADRLHVKPHFVDPDPGVGCGDGGYALFAGRLSREKGVETLLAAWEELHTRLPLVIAGNGPLASTVGESVARLSGVRWVGHQSRADMQRLVSNAAILVFPSVVFETFGQTIIEAYAAGTPVAASSGGAAAELIAPRRTGFLFTAGDARDLTAQITDWLSQPWRMAAMRAGARASYEARFTGDANYRQLEDIYQRAIDRRLSSRRAPANHMLDEEIAS